MEYDLGIHSPAVQAISTREYTFEYRWASVLLEVYVLCCMRYFMNYQTYGMMYLNTFLLLYKVSVTLSKSTGSKRMNNL
jgi:hypothetical protein